MERIRHCFYKICSDPPVMKILLIPDDDPPSKMFLCQRHADFVFHNPAGCGIKILEKFRVKGEE